ncbi:TPA: prephenate dehydrogenase/arogenate dehydrogenase family protein [Candidatus Bathyarchaeota archaeon]|nr:prephenate dehydrogenase/arogenate dehydrogenase family protein [Candidatus Bathyarchaeota archaeon]HIJ07795.1 prephenate dehydrogenase/arogenate dehydrogenase family protein [Candidatus Bathyarchaeota archaeon]
MVKTAILGAGKMGVWFAKFCKENGEEVILASRNKKKLKRLGRELGVETANFEEAVKKADNVAICVSIDSFEEVVKKIAPVVREGQTIIDICSVKEKPVKIMHQHLGKALVLGTHPVFGPGSRGVKNKTYILTPTSAKEIKFAEKYKRWLEEVGAHVFIMAPKEHDELMSTVLGMPHFVGLVSCDALLEQCGFADAKKVAGTTYKMLLTLAEATALETPDLFATLQTSLPELERIEDLFISKAKEWRSLVKQKDSGALIGKLEQLKARLLQADREYEKSYETMYKMLEAAEN